jgi:hypothetical protein
VRAAFARVDLAFVADAAGLRRAFVEAGLRAPLAAVVRAPLAGVLLAVGIFGGSPLLPRQREDGYMLALSGGLSLSFAANICL